MAIGIGSGAQFCVTEPLPAGSVLTPAGVRMEQTCRTPTWHRRELPGVGEIPPYLVAEGLLSLLHHFIPHLKLKFVSKLDRTEREDEREREGEYSL